MVNINFQHLIPPHFSDNSHVRIYQSSKPFNTQERLLLGSTLLNFTSNWKSQGIRVKGWATVLYDQFIILMADEDMTEGKMLRTHTSVELIKNIEQDLKVELFDKLMLAFIVQEKIQLLPLPRLNALIEKDLITPETLYFNNAILTKKELLNNWIIAVKDSWLSARFLEKNEVETE